MRARSAILSIFLVAYLLMATDRDWDSPLVIMGYVAGPYVVGVLAGWRAIPVFAGVYVAALILYQVLFWSDDPELSGIDDLPPAAGVVFVLPWLLVLIAMGSASRTLGARMHGRRDRA